MADREYPPLPKPAAHRYWSAGHSSRWQLAGRAVPPNAEPLFTAEQMQAYFDLASPGAAQTREGAFERAMRMTWQMVDPLNPSGQPGSYARGEYNGIVAALRTVRDNYRIAASQPVDGVQGGA